MDEKAVPKHPIADKCVREIRRSDRMNAAQSSPPTRLTTIRPEMVEDKSDSAITKKSELITRFLEAEVECLNVLICLHSHVNVVMLLVMLLALDTVLSVQVLTWYIKYTNSLSFSLMS